MKQNINFKQKYLKNTGLVLHYLYVRINTVLNLAIVTKRILKFNIL